MITLGGKTPETIFIASKEVAAISINNDQVWVKTQPTPPTPTVDYFYIENTYNGNNTLTLFIIDTGTASAGTHATSVEYSKDKNTWTTLQFQNSFNDIPVAAGETVYLRNDSGSWSYGSTYIVEYQIKISCSQSFTAGGDLLTLIDYTDTTGITSLPKCSFAGLLSGTNLTDASAIKIPSMTSDGCYANMFTNCTSLTVAPSLPATTLASDCYMSMFNGCTSLTTAPALPATTLADYCYFEMFKGCSSLNDVTISASDISAEGCLNDWLDGVSQTGTFYRNGFASFTIDDPSGIPAGWVSSIQRRFVWTNTEISAISGNQSELTSDLQVNMPAAWDYGVFGVYNAFDRDRSINFYPSDLVNGVLTPAQKIAESSPSSLTSPASVEIYLDGTIVWYDDVNFTTT